MLDEIVLIDDDRTTNRSNRQLIRQLLPELPIRTFENAEDGLRYLIEAQDAQLNTLVFLDLDLPVMSGFEFLDVYENAIAYQDHHFTLCLLSDQCHVGAKALSQYPSVLQHLPKPLTKARAAQVIEQASTATSTYSKRRAFW